VENTDNGEGREIGGSSEYKKKDMGPSKNGGKKNPGRRPENIYWGKNLKEV